MRFDNQCISFVKVSNCQIVKLSPPPFPNAKRTTVETHCMRLNAGTCEIKHISTRFKNDSTNEHQRCDPRRNPMRSVGYEKQRLIAHRRCRLTSTKGRNIVTDWVASPRLPFLVISLQMTPLRGSTNKTVL